MRYKRRMLKRTSFLLVLAAALTIQGCEECDNQANLPPEVKDAINKISVDAQLPLSNHKHKVLVSVIDGGVELDNPLLLNNIHFDLSPFGRPRGAGYDFIGEDKWPMPYLARNPSPLDPERVEAERELVEAFDVLAEDFPNLARYVSPHRALGDERTSVLHGTHVAGLVALNNPKIGILPYRVFPVPRYDNEGRRLRGMLAMNWFGDVLVAAIHQSVKDGARIVNMSLGRSYKPSDWSLRSLAERVGKAIAAHPDVLFIAAAGNEGEEIADKKMLQFPCGLKLSNILCVGALDANFAPTKFSNFPTEVQNLVFAPGADIRSTIPRKLCSAADLEKIAKKYVKFRNAQAPSPLYEFDEKGKLVQENIMEATERLERKCTQQNDKHYPGLSLNPLSGTSMAAPMVANLMARIAMKFPEATPAELIARLNEISVEKDIPGFPGKVRIAPIGKPSWKCLLENPGKEASCFRFVNGFVKFNRIFKDFE
jgi:subtilisin family serine protease